MNSERMRTELESFVNTGLRQGWCGWPRKDAIREGRVPAWRLDMLGPANEGPVALTRDRFGGGSDGFSTRYGLLY